MFAPFSQERFATRTRRRAAVAVQGAAVFTAGPGRVAPAGQRVGEDGARSTFLESGDLFDGKVAFIRAQLAAEFFQRRFRRHFAEGGGRATAVAAQRATDGVELTDPRAGRG